MTGQAKIELTILMPCLNEAETLGVCIRKAMAFLNHNEVVGEVVIADNGSTDGSIEIAQSLGARVVNVSEKGYGAALIGGIKDARGRFVVMGDSDDSYDFSSLEEFLRKLRAGYQLVMGNRFLGGVMPGAMPPLHRYLGNPVLSFVGRLFFGGPARDFHCGLRGFDREAVLSLGLQTPGMEFASEMVVKAILRKLRITEVPTMLHPDGRSRPPHLRSWRDGWRHLRFLLLFSPRWLFIYPGAIFMALGWILQVVLFFGPLSLSGVTLDVHTMLIASAFSLLGFQMLWLGVFTKVIGARKGILPLDRMTRRIDDFLSLETGCVLGAGLILVGLALIFITVFNWEMHSFGALNPAVTMRYLIPGTNLFALGVEVTLSAFFLSVIRLPNSYVDVKIA